jgi:hypothetical protein
MVVAEGATVTIAVVDVLDSTSGDALVATVSTAIDGLLTHLEIDLCGLTAFTAAGAAALVTCRELCSSLSDGLHYRTSEGPGRDALLSAFDDHANIDPVA